MKQTKIQQILETIIENSRKDREKLEKYAEALVSVLGEGAAVETAESMAKVADALTRNNAQLVEVAKMLTKDQPADEGGLSEKDKEAAYSEMQNDKFIS